MADANVVQCNSCGGIYKPAQHDGTQYFHACPSVRVVTGAVVDATTGVVKQPAVFQPIANRRDENVLRVAADGTAVIKSAGGGIVPVFDPAVIAAAGFTTE